MATSTINFCKVDFRPEQNAYVDSLSTYLATLTKKTIQNFQYISYKQDITIKINEEQSTVSTFDYNYAIVNDGVDDYYYYVTSIDWISEHCCKVDLHLDSINTLGQGNTSVYNPKNFDRRTHITRTHKNRFYAPDDVVTYPYIASRKIDRVKEDFNPVEWDKTYDISIEDSRIENAPDKDLDWYLVYHSDSTDSSSPIKLSLCPNKSIDIVTTNINSTIRCNKEEYVIGEDTPVVFGNQIYLLFNHIGDKVNIDDKLILTIGADLSVDWIAGAVDRPNCTLAAICYAPHNTTRPPQSEDGNSINRNSIWLKAYDNDTQTYHWYAIYKKLKFITVNQNTNKIIYKIPLSWATYALWTTLGDYYYHLENELLLINGNQAYTTYNFSTLFPLITENTLQTFSLTSINNINKSDPKLNKIICVPYCPIQVKWDEINNRYNYASSVNWSYISDSSENPPLDNHCLRYNSDLSVTDSILEINNDLVVDLSEDLNYNITTQPIYKDGTINYGLESKLNSSQFEINKLVYDSTDFQIELDRVGLTDNTSLPISYKVSNEVSSTFAFSPTLSNLNYNEKENYDGVMIINSKNEVPIYNNAYVEYIKNGYNYELKENALNLKQSKVNAVSNILSSTARGMIAGNKTAAITGAVSGIVTSAINISQMQESQQLAMNNKISQLSNQSVSVVDNNDLGIKKWYMGDNKLHYMIFKPESNFKQMIYEYMRLYGYKCNEYSIPTINTRIWYNFLQCEPFIKKNGLNKAKEMIVDDLIEKYKDGVTIYHKQEINGVNTWDFEQKYENWETFWFNEE